MGIDYGRGTTNIDVETGIRYGVMSYHDVLQAWCDEAEAKYLDNYTLTFQQDGVEQQMNFDAEDEEHAEEQLRDHFKYDDSPITIVEIERDESNDDFADPCCFRYNEDGYIATQSFDSPYIFITKSNYYTLCNFCSPCYPGAGDIGSKGDVKAYCFGHDWFADGVAPYRVFRVDNNEEILPNVS